MAVTPLTLKSNTFLALDDVKDWLRIKDTDTTHDNRLIRLINMATDLCEKYIGGPIKTRSFVETRSGDSSNTIMPSYWPVRSITEIRIDYNREFPDATIIEPSNYLLEGPPDYFEVAVMGQDVVLRSENASSIIGRIFNGSVVGSIKMSYTAGWGADQQTIEANLVHAVLMTVEYYYILKENRELNVTGKNNNGQNYSRTQGLPKEVVEILDEYKDFSFGFPNVPQKNRFSV